MEHFTRFQSNVYPPALQLGELQSDVTLSPVALTLNPAGEAVSTKPPEKADKHRCIC